MPDARRAHVSAVTIAQAADAFDAFCAAQRLALPATWQLRVALDEVVSNILTHGAAGGRRPAVDIEFHRLAGGVEVIVADDGPPFDPTSQPPPDVAAPLAARHPGGLGIALVKSLVDGVRYERSAPSTDRDRERNILVLWKTIVPDGSGAPE